MKVILNTDVANLGEEGDIKEVKSGYARNFIIPRKLGMPYNKANIALIESRREAIEKRKEEKRQAALGLKGQLESNPLAIAMTTGRNGKLFGSVNTATIAAELEKAGIVIERKAIEIPEKTIKAVGNYKVAVKLYGGETAQLTVAVSSSKVVAEEDEPKKAAPVEATKDVEEAQEESQEEVSQEADSAQDSDDEQ